MSQHIIFTEMKMCHCNCFLFNPNLIHFSLYICDVHKGDLVLYRNEYILYYDTICKQTVQTKYMMSAVLSYNRNPLHFHTTFWGCLWALGNRDTNYNGWGGNARDLKNCSKTHTCCKYTAIMRSKPYIHSDVQPEPPSVVWGTVE